MFVLSPGAATFLRGESHGSIVEPRVVVFETGADAMTISEVACGASVMAVPPLSPLAASLPISSPTTKATPMS